jgi:hypothetical protein
MDSERNIRNVGELRELADFLEAHGEELPDHWITTTLYVTLTETAWADGETTIDEAATKDNIARFLDAVGSCEKDYRDDRIKITKKYSNNKNDMVVGLVDRSIACKKVVTGQKFVQAQYTPARMEEEYEWKCDENISLLKLVR